MSPGPPPDGEDESPTEVLLTEARRVVDQQIKELDRADQKAARSLQAVFVLLGLAVSAREVLTLEPAWPLHVQALAVIAVGGWTVGIAGLLFAYSSSDGEFGAISMAADKSDTTTTSTEKVRSQLVKEYSEAVNANSTMITVNTYSLIAGQIAVGVGTVAAATVLVLWM